MSVIEALLEDVSRYPRETSVQVLAGLRGSWRMESAGEKTPTLRFRVSEVVLGSAFAAAGIQPGDILESVEGGAFQGAAPLLVPLLAAARQGAAVAVGVRRGSSSLSVQVPPVFAPAS